MNKFYFFCSLLLILSCAKNDKKGEFLREEIKKNETTILIDSIWKNYKIREYKNKKHGLSHKYHFVDSIEPFEYSVEYEGKILMKYDSIHKEESYKIGSSIHILSDKRTADSIEFEILTACPYTMRNCFYVNIFQEYRSGIIDTILVDYQPKGDILLVRVDNKIASKLNVEAFLCESEFDRLYIPLK
jgi:hypothetical protein